MVQRSCKHPGQLGLVKARVEKENGTIPQNRNGRSSIVNELTRSTVSIGALINLKAIMSPLLSVR